LTVVLAHQSLSTAHVYCQ